jgi:hypothetical protein
VNLDFDVIGSLVNELGRVYDLCVLDDERRIRDL